MLDIDTIRKDFPILEKKIRGKPLCYLDNGASAQKPNVVIETVKNGYEDEYANVHRGLHFLSNIATEKFEAVRGKIQNFLGAKSENEIIFTKSATEGINLIAQTFYEKYMQKGDEVILSLMEHHSNLIPWFFLRDKYGVVIKFAKINQYGEIDYNHFESLFTDKTKIVSLTHLSNVFGTELDKKAIKICNDKKVPILLDGCQSAAHLKIDVQQLECDFFVFSGHKTYGPAGIGVLYGVEELLSEMPPYQGGGGMIGEVSLEGASYADLPAKYEAGTPPLVEAHGLGVAIDYMNNIGIEKIIAHETELTKYAFNKLNELDFVEMHGGENNRNSIISFNLKNVHSHEVSSFLDVEGIAIRAGHHCCQPLMKHLGVNSTARLSFGIYNTVAEVDKFIEALHKCQEFFNK